MTTIALSKEIRELRKEIAYLETKLEFLDKDYEGTQWYSLERWRDDLIIRLKVKEQLLREINQDELDNEHNRRIAHDTRSN